MTIYDYCRYLNKHFVQIFVLLYKQVLKQNKMEKVYLIFLTSFLAGSFSLAVAQNYSANPDKTVILWEGKKVGGKHEGTIKLKSADIEMNYKRPVSGTVIIDMTSIKDTDIKNEGMRKRLEDHLRSDDFFSVEKFPEAKFEITGSEILNGGAIKIMGNITIKGTTQPLEFVSDLTASEESLIFTGHIDIDRTLFDVRYGSTKFFDNIADSAIDDIFTLDYELYLKME